MGVEKMGFEVLGLLAFLAVARSQTVAYNHAVCNTLTNCLDCTTSVDVDSLTVQKCIPIHPSSSSGHTCADWDDVQNNGYPINFSCNNQLIPAQEQAYIDKLRFFISWAWYSYKPTNLLQDQKIFQDSSTDTLVAMGYDPTSNCVVTSFRGSHNFMNWVLDFQFLKTDYSRPGCSDCQVHDGFFSAYNANAKKILDYIPTLVEKYPSATVLVTGHSLGAAEAAFCAVDFQLLGYDVHLYTYGMPRAGDINFANYVDNLISGPYYRGVYLNDPVPDVPPYHLGYIHSGTEIHFYDCTSYLANPAYADDEHLADVTAANDHLKYPCIKVPWPSYA